MERNRRDNSRIIDFEDINSSSRQAQPRRPRPASNTVERPVGSRSPRSNRPSPERRPAQSRPPRRREPEWDISSWDMSNRRSVRAAPERTSPGGARPPRPERRPPPRKRTSKPMSRGARRALVSLIVLAMATVTVFLAVFLLFKVSTIEITGDAVPGCTNERILEICGYKVGDNLVFISTTDREERLKTQLPYVGNAEISRHLPGTVEIKLTAAQVAASISCGSDWLYVSSTGKILEKQAAPKADTLQIIGLNPIDPEVGHRLQIEDDSAETAYVTILSALSELNMISEFDRLDVSDLSNITMLYQNRIEFRFGNILELEYKINLGCRSVAELSTGEKGIMDLSYADETKRAIFTAGSLDSASAQPTDDTPTEDTPSGDSTDNTPDVSEGDDTASTDDDSPGRGDDIPDDVFTGEAEASSALPDEDGDY